LASCILGERWQTSGEKARARRRSGTLAAPDVVKAKATGAAGSEPRLFAARDPLDLSGDETFHDKRQIVVKPGFEHGTQHLAGKTNDDIAMLDKPAGKKRIKGRADGAVRAV
jgi:hypothetical protein